MSLHTWETNRLLTDGGRIRNLPPALNSKPDARPRAAPEAPVIAVLQGRLADGHFTVRQEAVRVLAKIARTNGDVFAAISDLCQTDPHHSVRLGAASVLELFAPHNREVVLQAIIRVSADGQDPDVRRVAVRALAWHFAISGEAIAAILRRLVDEDSGVRSFAESCSTDISRILARIA